MSGCAGGREQKGVRDCRGGLIGRRLGEAKQAVEQRDVELSRSVEFGLLCRFVEDVPPRSARWPVAFYRNRNYILLELAWLAAAARSTASAVRAQ